MSYYRRRKRERIIAVDNEVMVFFLIFFRFVIINVFVLYSRAAAREIHR